jgi:hypothetical protein
MLLNEHEHALPKHSGVISVYVTLDKKKLILHPNFLLVDHSGRAV